MQRELVIQGGYQCSSRSAHIQTQHTLFSVQDFAKKTDDPAESKCGGIQGVVRPGFQFLQALDLLHAQIGIQVSESRPSSV